ncbi:hypothetical protein L0F63_001998, partial [Massospora cicadina]
MNQQARPTTPSTNIAPKEESPAIVSYQPSCPISSVSFTNAASCFVAAAPLPNQLEHKPLRTFASIIEEPTCTDIFLDETCEAMLKALEDSHQNNPPEAEAEALLSILE